MNEILTNVAKTIIHAKKKARIAEKKALIAEKKALIAEKKARIAEKKARIAEKKARIAEKKAKQLVKKAIDVVISEAPKKVFLEENYKGSSKKDLIIGCPEFDFRYNLKLKSIEFLETTDIGRYFALYLVNPKCENTILTHIIFIGKEKTKLIFDTIKPHVVPLDFAPA